MAKWRKNRDPYADREAEKYDNPIPSREFIIEHLEKAKEPLTHRQLCEAFRLEDDMEVEALRRRLRAMERDGQLMRNRKGAYGLIRKMDLILGRVSGHRDGFGFLIPDEGGDDLYLSPRQMRSVFDGDKVLARVSGIDRRGRSEGTIVEVVERNVEQVVGRFYLESGVGFVVPDNSRINQDILVPPEGRQGAREGQFVVVEITVQPSYRHPPQGQVIEVLGEHMAPGMEIDVAIRAHEIPHVWPEEVLQQAKEIPDQVQEKDKRKRIDIRHLPLVTIDGEDARDFDDAVFCEKKKSGGFRLIVAIADVTHYVPLYTPLDLEAERRGNSVYFPDNVIPMLPEKLSNGLCSLNPKVDRLCMACELSISAKGKLSRFRFFEGVMRSHARLTYTQVGEFLDPDTDTTSTFEKEHAGLTKPIAALHELYKVLRKARDERGAIDFDTVETQILFGPDRKIEDIVPTTRNDAHKIIEECMLCANVAAAKVAQKYKLPVLYRVHQGPKDEKLANLKAFLGAIGLTLPGGDQPEPSDYQTLLQQVADRPDANIIQTVMLRSLSQAVYTPQNEGHFGLGYEAYAHFTSPIRRYPDLLLHRALRWFVRNHPDSPNVMPVEGAKSIPAKHWIPYDDNDMVRMGEHCSLTERRADDATRDVVDWLKCEYMMDQVGRQFKGLVSSVTAFGLFVELSYIYVEGLIHVSNLSNDYYHFDAITHSLTGERSGVRFRLGDELLVQVARVDLDDRKIDFELIDKLKSAPQAKTGLTPPKVSSKKSAKKKRTSAQFGKGKTAGKGKGKGKGGKPKRETRHRVKRAKGKPRKNKQG